MKEIPAEGAEEKSLKDCRQNEVEHDDLPYLGNVAASDVSRTLGGSFSL